MMHKPVLLQEVLDACKPEPGGRFIDATANGGGHTFALWDAVRPSGTVLAVDKDQDLVAALTMRKERERADGVVPVCGSYTDLDRIAREYGMTDVDGIVFDLGYSSWHIEGAGRGFTFQKDEPLIMRYEAGPITGLTAAEVVNSFPETELADIIFRYGDERSSRRIAKAIVQARKTVQIMTSGQLADIIIVALGRRGRLHPATKTFQALRIFVNEELDRLEESLEKALGLLREGGRLAVISFHSGEDRIVKDFFKKKREKQQAIIITKKPIVPGRTEIMENPRARSAKLRVLSSQRHAAVQ